MPQEWLRDEIYGNPLSSWLTAFLVAIAAALAARFIKWIARRHVQKAADESGGRILRILGRALDHTRWFFYFVVAIRLGSEFVTLPANVDRVISVATAIAVLGQLGIWANAFIAYAVETYQSGRQPGDAGASTMAAALGFFGKLAVWVVVLLLVLANLGIEISALIAGLGITGIAAALAVQSILGDFIGAISIFFDRPFDIGDFIIVGNELGTVEKVGLRATRIRSLTGEQIVLPNGDLLKNRIRNMRRMQERRIVFSIGVTYSTPRAKLELIPGMIRELIEADPMLRFARSHFKAYGDFSLVFETVYFVLSPEFDVYMDAQQRLNLGIHSRFEEHGIEFAFPTQTIHLHQELTAERTETVP